MPLAFQWVSASSHKFQIIQESGLDVLHHHIRNNFWCLSSLDLNHSNILHEMYLKQILINIHAKHQIKESLKAIIVKGMSGTKKVNSF